MPTSLEMGVPLVGSGGLALTPPAPTYVDDFTRADSATSLGSHPNGSAYVAHAGTWGIASNQAYSASDGTTDRVSCDGGRNDGTFSVDVTGGYTSATKRTPGLLFRGLDGQNFLWLTLEPNLSLWKLDAGAAGNLRVVVAAPVDGTTYQLRAVCAGTSIECWWGSTLGFTYTLAGGDTKFAGPTYTRVGLRLTKNGTPTLPGRADNLSIGP